MTKSFFKRKVYNEENIKIGDLNFKISYKKIRKLYLKIKNDDASLEIKAPINIDQKIIIDFINKKIEWINKNRNHILAKNLAKKTKNNDEIIFLGEVYKIINLNLSKKPKINLISRNYLEYFTFEDEAHKINFKNSINQDEANKINDLIANGIINNQKEFDQNPLINLKENPINNAQNYQQIVIINSLKTLDSSQNNLLLEKFYRHELLIILENLITKWQKIIGVKVDFFNIKKMRTRHGSCNAKHKRIWFSLNLIHHKIEFIEYVVVHEILHFFQQNHGKKFYALLDHYLPKWRSFKQKG